MVVIYVLGALTSSALYVWLGNKMAAFQQDPDPGASLSALNSLGKSLLRKGPDTLTRRCATLWALPFLPFIMREIRWGGWRDTGWVKGERFDRGHATRWSLIGLSIGILSLSAVGLLLYALNARVGRSPDHVFLHVLRVTAQCLAVATLEETAVRGVLLRSISRSWTFWPAALFTSIGFAVFHFMKPVEAVYSLEASVWANTWNGLSSMLLGLSEVTHLIVRGPNLILMSLALCVCWRKTGTIWLGIGLHAGWVWVKLMNGYLSDVNKLELYRLWLGSRSDTTDGLLCTLILGSILIWALLPDRKISAVEA